MRLLRMIFGPASPLLTATVLIFGPALSGSPAFAQQVTSEAISFESHGAVLRGIIFSPADAGPHPSLMLLHGYPGGTGDVLGIGRAAAEEGWRVLVFTHRGMHESEGTFSLSNALADLPAAISYLRSRGEAPLPDAARVAAAGYSFGGWVSLMAGILHEEVTCSAAIGPANYGPIARRAEENPEAREQGRSMIEPPMLDGRVRSSFDTFYSDMVSNADQFDLVLRARALTDDPVLIIGGWKDTSATLEEFILPVVRALRSSGNGRVTPVILDDDHRFREKRDDLHRVILEWLAEQCAP